MNFLGVLYQVSASLGVPLQININLHRLPPRRGRRGGCTDRSCRECCPAGMGSWRRCCWGVRTRGCQAAGCPPGTAPGKGCPGSSPANNNKARLGYFIHGLHRGSDKIREVGLKVTVTNGVSEVKGEQNSCLKSSIVMYSQNQHRLLQMTCLNLAYHLPPFSCWQLFMF